MAGINFPQMEEEVLQEWEQKNIFEKTLSKEAPKGDFVFYEGPPTANGRPGIHHVESRAFKDVVPRYKTMQGYRVDRKAGWDTHGLPVELEVEKKLGISGKPQIEKLKLTVEESIEYFNQLCKESVWTYLADWNKITRRIGFWLDLENPYVTYETPYMESLWWVIKTIWDKDLMYKDYKIVPYCGRCGTALSSHEVAQGYKEVVEPSVYVRFRITESKNRSFLVWTTTPWTLPANTALAVGSDIDYVEVQLGDEYLILSKSRLVILEGQEYKIIKEMKGSELAGITYEPLFNLATPEKPAHRVITGDFVSTGDGSGIVHIAPAFGEDDLRASKENNIPVLMTVNEEGKFAFDDSSDPLGTQLNGMFVKDGDSIITEDLKSRGLLFSIENYTHEYPFCWRCSTPLIYYAKFSWFFAMSKVKDNLLKNADQITWTPSYIKEGRFGEWIRGVRDWAISRERYWGTPLPVWVCGDCDEKACIGSIEELQGMATDATRPKGDPKNIDIHRPFIDAVELVCTCGGTMHRIPDVIDVWFDSGCMPFAQWHYPFENKDKVDDGKAFPAEYIAEAIDQTRGWFYTLLAVSTLLGKEAPYKNVISLGHILDVKGQKMSKSKGNVVDPFRVIDTYGADAIRFYMFTVNQPGEPKRFDEADIEQIVKNTFNILWNVSTFWDTYKTDTTNVTADHILDRWIRAKQHELIESVTKNMDTYRITEAGRSIAAFITDLSTWYLRRSRDRFRSDDQDQASATLREALMTTAKLIAPFTPFIAESLYKKLDGKMDSVHLEDWPTPDPSWKNTKLLEEMAHTRRIVSFGHEARSRTKFPIRQPLAQATILAPKVGDGAAELIREELNVHSVKFDNPRTDSIIVELDIELTPELKAEGAIRELTRRIQNLRKAAGLTVNDTIDLWIAGADDDLLNALSTKEDELKKAVRAKTITHKKAEVEHDTTVKLGERMFWIGIKKA